MFKEFFINSAYAIFIVLSISIFMWMMAMAGCLHSASDWIMCGQNDMTNVMGFLLGWIIK